MRFPLFPSGSGRPDLPEAPPPPGTEAVAATFAALARLRRETAAVLPDAPVDTAFDPNRFATGVPLLTDRDPAAFEAAFLAAATAMLPRLADSIPAVAGQAAILAEALVREPGLACPIAGAVLDGQEDAVAGLADKLGLPPGGLVFLTREIASAVLHREAAVLSPVADDALWHKSYCPICGAAPDLGLLKEKPEPSEFLVAKAGRLLLHCSLCGHLWRFPRLRCPSCGEGEQEKLGLFIAAGRERERIHTCETCRRYWIVLDRVEAEARLDPDAVPAGLAHLDAAAQARGFTPLCRTAWNQFEEDDLQE
jgi:FdhE protein